MHRRIAAIGDSHALRCFENHSVIADAKAYSAVNRLDGRTAYKLADHDELLRSVISSLKDKQLIFCFGEVDVRIHIKYQSELTGVPTGELIAKTAQRYSGYVYKLREDGYRIHVFNVVPTGVYAGRQYEGWKQNLHYPFTTTFTERQRFTLQLNECLRSECGKRHIPFVDIYDHLVDSRGMRRAGLIYDFSHLNARTADIVLEQYCFSEKKSPHA